jgi:2-polyprenyl-6-methoxyphenol hydroxylase-like FAD-dependent oxidoreductase
MSEITIVGAGIAGLALGLGCARRGWNVTLCERSLHLEPVGAGLTLGSSAVSGLGYLGLGDAISDFAEPPDPGDRARLGHRALPDHARGCAGTLVACTARRTG